MIYIFQLATEIVENGHSDRIIDYGIPKQKRIEQELGCKFIIIDPDKDFYIFKTINEIIRHVEKSTKKTPINKISTRLLRLQFKSDNIIESKAIKLIIKKILPDYK